MSRPEYLNLRVTENRTRWLDVVCDHLHIAPDSRGYQQAIDYALMRVVDEPAPENRQAVMVNERDGYYQIDGAADVVNWEGLLADLPGLTVERVETLTGWAPYTAAYRLQLGDETWTYFVAE